MGRIQFVHTFEDIISIENLLYAWKEFARGKRKKRDVGVFEMNLMDGILALHDDLRTKQYRHGPYVAFNISDPKPRNIHKASVRDRLLHHALYRRLYPFFDRTFIADSYSCREGKGVHKALNRFRSLGSKASKNNTRTAWVLKCDIKKFFASIDHDILKHILSKHIRDSHILWLLEEVINSFTTVQSLALDSGRGLPLGNLTSQLLVNIYMNEFDQWVKHKLKATYYIRYADDFVILHHDRKHLEKIVRYIERFVGEELQLELHPRKVFIETFASGVDFLGWVHFPDHQVLRTVTKRWVMKAIEESDSIEVLQSYTGLLGHGNARGLRAKIIDKMLIVKN